MLRQHLLWTFKSYPENSLLVSKIAYIIFLWVGMGREMLAIVFQFVPESHATGGQMSGSVVMEYSHKSCIEQTLRILILGNFFSFELSNFSRIF